MITAPEGFYDHDVVPSAIPAKTPAAELALFESILGPSTSSGSTQDKLIERVTTFGVNQGFNVVQVTPGTDKFLPILSNPNARILVIVPPGNYFEQTYHLYGSNWDDLWFYGVSDGTTRPRILGLRAEGSQYSSNSFFWGASNGQRLLLENLEIAGFASNTINQAGNADLLIRGCHIHSNGGRAVYRGVGCEYSADFGSTYLVDSDFRHASSHTIYLDYARRSVISGCKVSRQGKNAYHCIKNITSEASLVQGSTFADGLDGHLGSESTNPWVKLDIDPVTGVREYGGSTPYDGMTGTDWILIKDCTFQKIGASSGIIDTQNRSAASGNHQAYPAPELGYTGWVTGHINGCNAVDALPALTPYADIWQDDYWASYTTRKTYVINNTFEVPSRTDQIPGMLGFIVEADHPQEYNTQTGGGKQFSVSAGYTTYLTGKLDGRVTMELFHSGNTFPATLPLDRQWDWHSRRIQPYGSIPAKSAVIQAHVGDAPNPVEQDPYLRAWSGAQLVNYWDENQEPDPIPDPDPDPIPDPEPEPEPEPEPTPTPTPVPPATDPGWQQPTPPTSEWTETVKHEWSDGQNHWQEVIRYRPRYTTKPKAETDWTY